MTDEELRRLVESNAKAIQALADRQIESQRQVEQQIAQTNRQVSELTRTVSTFVRETSGAVSHLMDDRATMFELVSQVSESQATMNESMAQIASAITLLANRNGDSSG